jgi:hypothetical protein
MAELLKHVGKFGEKPCVLVMRKLPNDEVHCLITQTASLPPTVHDELMSVVQSSEGQAANSLADVLHRKSFSDGEQMLSKLHYSKLIQKVPVNLVDLTPAPNKSVPLVEVNKEIDKLDDGYKPPRVHGQDNVSLVEEAQNPNQPVEVAPTVASKEAPTAEKLLQESQQLKAQAEAMLSQADIKLREAYRLNPELKPVE